jgi:hypothetical protein
MTKNKLTPIDSQTLRPMRSGSSSKGIQRRKRNHSENHSHRALISISIDKRKLWFALSFWQKDIVDSHFPFGVDKGWEGRDVNEELKDISYTQSPMCFIGIGENPRGSKQTF